MLQKQDKKECQCAHISITFHRKHEFNAASYVAIYYHEAERKFNLKCVFTPVNILHLPSYGISLIMIARLTQRNVASLYVLH